jgi:hypothetical protein
MSYNIDHVTTLSSTLRISRENADKARLLDMPECNNLDDLKFGEDDYAPISTFWFYGECSGHAYDKVLDDYVALLEGDADLILFWEGGEMACRCATRLCSESLSTACSTGTRR